MKTVIIFGRRYPVRGLLTAFGGMLMMVRVVRSKSSNQLFVTNNFRSVSRPSFPSATSWLMQFLTWGTTLTLPWHMQTLYMSHRYSSCVYLLIVIVRFIWQGKALVSGCTSFISGILARKLGLRPTFIIGCILYRSHVLLIVLWQKNNSFVLSSSGGYLVSYLSVDAGLWALVLSIAVSSGFGVSLVYSNVVNTTMRVMN